MIGQPPIERITRTRRSPIVFWVMPEWMEPYRQYIYTGGHLAEDVMNGRAPVRRDLVAAQVDILSDLRQQGALK